MSFPRSVGQIPIYYNHFNTGRPPAPEVPGVATSGYVSHYTDERQSPRYAFGHGLSYTTFAYGELALDKPRIASRQTLGVSVKVTNTGARAGEEVVQLYLRDPVASVVRPVKELIDFRRVRIEPGQTQTLHFTIDREKLSFYNVALQWVAEPGAFELMVGASSADIRQRARFELVE
jgi:beta-glucosidase